MTHSSSRKNCLELVESIVKIKIGGYRTCPYYKLIAAT